MKRLQQAWSQRAPHSAHVGLLVFVVPPSRVLEVCRKLETFYEDSTPFAAIGEGWSRSRTVEGVDVAVCSWAQLLGSLAPFVPPTLTDDVTQLRQLTDLIDQTAFKPWSTEQVTDRDVATRLFQLVALVDSTATNAVSNGVATRPHGHKRSKYGYFAYGQVLALGGVP